MAWRGLVLLFLSLSPGLANAVSNNAIKKVIEMLTAMQAKGSAEMKEEQIAFAKFGVYCEETTRKLTEEIANNAETLDALKAEIAKLTSDIQELGEEVAALKTKSETQQAEVETRTKERATQHEAFLAEQQDYSESVDALDRAIATLKKQSHDRPAALLQMTQQDWFPVQTREMLQSLLSVGTNEADSSSPEANAYEFQSGGIVDFLKKLRDEFAEKKGELEKGENNQRHAFEMVVQDLSDSIKYAKEDIESKTALKAKKTARKAQAGKESTQTATDKAENEKVLADLSRECKEKNASFEEKQALRKMEIEAIGKAIEILGSGDVSAGTKHLALVQKSPAFLQVGSQATAEGIHRKIREFIAAEGRRLHSKGLMLLADKITADPFAKVKKLIDTMITRLLNEANEDAQHEGFCDKEIGQNKITREKLSKTIDELTASIDNGKVTIQDLTEEIASLSQGVADLTSVLKEATDIRKEEKETNKVRVEEAKTGLKAVEAAKSVLTDFYEKAGMATAFLQTSLVPVKMGSEAWQALANPNFTPQGSGGFAGGEFEGGAKVDTGHVAGQQTFGKSYSGNQDGATAVIALIDVAISDLANFITDTEGEEELSNNNFIDFKRETEKNIKVKNKQIEMDKADKAAAEVQLREDVKDLKATDAELLAAKRYYDKLEPQCIDQGMTWEERVEARKAEMASLKKALEILSQEDIA